MSNINLRQLIDNALLLRQKEHEDAEQGKLGGYRAGNTGIKLGNRWLGKCPRTTLLRSKGISTKEEDRLKHIMFSGGVLNEDVWMRDLQSVYKDGKILREEEVPTSWVTKGGTRVTGRPDIVLCDGTGKPTLGLELKMASSVWTARDVLILGLPKFDHLCQAGHYMWQLGVPFKLCYTSYVEYPVVGWMGKNFPKQGAPGSEYCDYNNKGDIKKLRPFVQIYDLTFDETTGILLYKLEAATKWTTSVISIEGIEEYFNGLDEIAAKRKLPARPETINVDGTKDGWSICDYCPVKSTCDKYEGDYQKWIEEVGQIPAITTATTDIK
jgi:hypothetical protein